MSEKRESRQSGKGALGTVVPLAVFAAFAMAVWNVAPAYMADYQLGDKMIEICRLGRGANTDDRIKELLMKEVAEEGLDGYLGKESFKIETHENSRKIRVEYQRTIKILPGWERNFTFSHSVDQPLIF
jgi:hypothetical protein